MDAVFFNRDLLFSIWRFCIKSDIHNLCKSLLPRRSTMKYSDIISSLFRRGKINLHFASVMIEIFKEEQRICASLPPFVAAPRLTYTQTWFLFGCQRISNEYEIMMSGYDSSLEGKWVVPMAPVVEWKNSKGSSFSIEPDREKDKENLQVDIFSKENLFHSLEKSNKIPHTKKKGDKYGKRSSKRDRKLIRQLTRRDKHAEDYITSYNPGNEDLWKDLESNDDDYDDEFDYYDYNNYYDYRW